MEVPAIASTTAPAVAAAGASTATQGAQAAAAPPAAPAAPAAPPTLGQVTEAVNAINRAMVTQSRGLEFSVDADSHRTVVKVIDSQTRELIRQIPTVETLEIAHALDQAQGLLIRQQA
jgi:flagellar protein FlaG